MNSRIIAPPPRARLRQVTGLDGLRGLAVAAVVIYHLFGDILPGGYLGVDMFFVLSGFLITSLLVREHRVAGRISLKTFWIRRFRRILPAAMFVLFACTAVVGLIGGDLVVGLRTQFLGTAFFASNWVQIATSQSYFADNEIQVFAHYWSLAVEEQFYVVWPLLAMVLLGVGRKALGLASLVLGVGSAVWMAALYEPGADPTRVYYGTDTHAFGLLAGAFLAVVLCSKSRLASADSWPARIRHEHHVKIVASILGVIATILYVAQLFLMEDTADVTYRGGLALTSVLGAIMIWAVVREAQPLHLIFSTRVMRYLGQRSFSLYLWHWPVMMMVGSSWLSLILSLALTELSYRLVENPIRRGGYARAWKNFCEMEGPRGALAWIAIPVTTVLVVAGAAGSVVNSSDKSQLEKDLEALAAANSSQAASTPTTSAAPPSESRRKKVNPLPSGSDITALGDSVMLASSAALQERFPGIYIDADVSRHYNVAPGIVESLRASGQLRKVVFLGFGTNGASVDNDVENLIEQIGPDHVIILSVPYGDRDWMPSARAEVLAAAKKHKNVYIADWCGHAQAMPSALRDDLIHPTLEGASQYAKAFYYATLQYAYGDKTVTSKCVD